MCIQENPEEVAPSFSELAEASSFTRKGNGIENNGSRDVSKKN